MEKLWSTEGKLNEYSSKKTSISMTFGGNRSSVLCYERKYTTLDEQQLLLLLKEAKNNNWTTLDLSDCGIEKLPDELWDIDSLRVLFLGNWKSEENHKNTFFELSSKIENLKNLEALSIYGMENLRIPKTFKNLPNLVYLDCFDCNFGKIPYNLLNKNLKAIGIQCLTVEQLTKICQLKKLEELFLSGSLIKELPIETGNLKFLKTLYICNSMVETIPESLLNLKQLKSFNIYNTPLEKQIPAEMKKQKAYDLINYICKQQKEQGSYFFNESKMIIVGQGNVGKSCLLERITNNHYEEKESTEGIDVKRWAYTKKRKNYLLNIWDFGGQEIYHSTHQFFLTKRSLYVFVWDARAEEEYGRIDYWLKTIESFAADSPIIICINKCDKNTTRINRIDFKEYKQKYPQIVTILDISCRDNINISRLKSLIMEHASSLQITKEKWLKSWYDIRKDIEKLSLTYKYISYSDYLSLCKKYDVNIEEAKSLSKYLHDLGVILHYQNDYNLNGTVILSPEWATSAVYKILDSQENVLSNRNGILYLNDLPHIWKDVTNYPEDKYIFLLKIMEKFQLCFELTNESYLVAELLENTSIDCPKGWDFKESSTIKIIYKYDFLPAGVMTRFIVKIHKYIAKINDKNLCWRKGVYLKYKSAYACVILKDTLEEKKIEVKVNKKGDSIDQRELLYIIRQTIDEINKNFNKIKVKEYVPCNCSSNCKFLFPYDTLCSALDQKVETIQCYESFKQINILKLLEGIDIMRSEKPSLYSINVEANPHIVVNPTIEANPQVVVSPSFDVISKTETNTSVSPDATISEIKSDISEIKDDILKIYKNIMEKSEESDYGELKEELEQININLESANKMESTDEIAKSDKFDKLKKLLIKIGDENSDLRKSLSGAAQIVGMFTGLVSKFALLTEKLGIGT